ncbi:MAG: DUF1156 domain-containing protein [candidate division KSB1 bacterium]|nr:DUF1156 domain-containing protein [candidate division KSB1 bacterium]
MTERRLIEDYIPIREISAEASREKSIRKGHISTLHLWWARRPLTACRAAVFGALVPAPKTPEERKELAAEMVELCRWKASDEVIERARQRILEANGGVPPKVLDMFAGGGSIPLEALRLGCEAYALELNPVAHLIELCTLVYPQQYGPELADEVKKWGQWVLKRVKAEIGDLYPQIPNPKSPIPNPQSQISKSAVQLGLEGVEQPERDLDVGHGELTPVAYLWTRTVRCPNPACGATVPLVRQTWLCKKKRRYVALRLVPDRDEMRARFEVVESQAATEKQALAEFGFDPAGFSRRGNAACPLCGGTVGTAYVKAEGKAGRMGTQPMAVVCTRKGERGKVYLTPSPLPPFPSPREERGRGVADRPEGRGEVWPDDAAIRARIERLCAEIGLTVPDEPLPPYGTLGFRVQPYGLTRWCDLFTPRQLLALLTFVKHVRAAHQEMLAQGMDAERARAVATYLGVWVDRVADYLSSLCVWAVTGEFIAHTFGRQALPMVWDFAEVEPLAGTSGSAQNALGWVTDVIPNCSVSESFATATRASATSLVFSERHFDVVITDPPYYDNVPYADLSDFFYIWLKRSVGHLYPEHFSAALTPKKAEAVADPSRHGKSIDAARAAYEQMMLDAFREANRVLKPGGPLVVVYAHKTTAGWSTLVDALRQAGFVVTEAWPLDTERPGRLREQASAALASSIFLVARRREGEATGDYVRDVRPQLAEIVRERVETLMGEGISGADLVIATVGAGLRAYTQYARVELASGQELDAKTYLDEVQREALEVILEKVMGVDRSGVGGVDKPTQYYVLGRYQYGSAVVPFDEANVLARGVGVELDAPGGLTWGRHALVEKQKDKVRLRDYEERGDDDKLGLPTDEAPLFGVAGHVPLVDVLHRLLWLLDHDPGAVPEFLIRAQPDAGQLRLVAQALAGRALAAEPSPGMALDARSREQQAIDRLLAAWKRVVEENLFVR